MTIRANRIRIFMANISILWAFELLCIAKPVFEKELPILLLYLLIVFVSACVLFTIAEAILQEATFWISIITAKIATIIAVLCCIVSFPPVKILIIS